MSKIVDINPGVRFTKKMVDDLIKKIKEIPPEHIAGMYMMICADPSDEETISDQDRLYITRMYNIDWGMIGYINTELMNYGLILKDQSSMGPDYNPFDDEDDDSSD